MERCDFRAREIELPPSKGRLWHFLVGCREAHMASWDMSMPAIFELVEVECEAAPADRRYRAGGASGRGLKVTEGLGVTALWACRISWALSASWVRFLA